jgi:glycosyltransferase involved in cell wall biosynthesis
MNRVTGVRGPRRSLLLVADQAGWILDEVAREVQVRLPTSLRARVVEREWADARACTIHFINRVWAWTDGALDRVHPSNRLIGLWWHGRLDSTEPAMQAAIGRLRTLHRRFDRLQVTCSIGRDTLLAVGVPPEKIVTLPEGVNLATFRPADESGRSAVRRELAIAEDTMVVGCFQKDGEGWERGDLPKTVKGPDVFVDALVRLHARRPVTALIPGPARGYVAGRLASAGIPFCAPGLVPRAALPRLYHALDLYVSPSRDEGGPAGLLEAMASGIPVVSTRAGMAVDLIESGANGVLVDVNDDEGLARAAADLIASPQARRAMAGRALSTIAQYDWSVLVPRYVRDLYEPSGRGPT